MSSTTDTTGRAATPIKTTKVQARGEDFRIIQLQGNLFVCSKANGNCCCGWTEKGRAPVKTALYESEWERRKIRNKIHLTFTGCLGPCATGNNALLQIFGQSIWLKDLNDDRYIPAIFDYIEAMLRENRVLPPLPELAEHIFARYLPPPAESIEIVAATTQAEDGAGLERLDPVCLMDVDPATARWQSEYNGRITSARRRARKRSSASRKRTRTADRTNKRIRVFRAGIVTASETCTKKSEQSTLTARPRLHVTLVAARAWRWFPLASFLIRA